MEVCQSLEVLLRDEAFINMGCTDRINLGCGFGSVSGNGMIRDMLECFEKEHFLKEDGKLTPKPFSTMIHLVVREYGFEIENRYQKKNGMVLYPCEVMSPLTLKGMENFFSDKTLAIHKETGTWKSNQEQEGVRRVISLHENRIL